MKPHFEAHSVLVLPCLQWLWHAVLDVYDVDGEYDLSAIYGACSADADDGAVQLIMCIMYKMLMLHRLPNMYVM